MYPLSDIFLGWALLACPEQTYMRKDCQAQEVPAGLASPPPQAPQPHSPNCNGGVIIVGFNFSKTFVVEGPLSFSCEGSQTNIVRG